MMWRVTEWLAVLWPPRWRYSWQRARHVIRVTELEPVTVGEDDPRFGTMWLDEEEARLWREENDALDLFDQRVRFPDEWDDPPAAFLPAPPPSAAEVWASRAAHGYIPELDTDPGDECAAEGNEAFKRMMLEGDREYRAALDTDPGPGVGPDPAAPGPDQVAKPAVTALNGASPCGTEAGREAGESGYLAPSRLAGADDIAEAHGWPTVRDQDADVADWLAAHLAGWARLRIGALA